MDSIFYLVNNVYTTLITDSVKIKVTLEYTNTIVSVSQPTKVEEDMYVYVCICMYCIHTLYLCLIDCRLRCRSEEIETGLFETKEQISSVSEELAIMIR